jgi:hypothetical protein
MAIVLSHVCLYGCYLAMSLHVTIFKNSVRTSQETHYISTTKLSRLMLFGEIIAIYCENHTEHTNTLFGQNVKLLMLNHVVF